VRGEDEESAVADGIANSAVDLGLGGGEVGDAAEVLEVLGVAEEHDALDLVLDGGAELADGVTDDGGTLAVSTGDDGGVGALGGGEVEETLGLVDGGAVGTGGEEVEGEVGGVRVADTLDPDVVAVGALESASESRASGGSL